MNIEAASAIFQLAFPNLQFAMLQLVLPTTCGNRGRTSPARLGVPRLRLDTPDKKTAGDPRSDRPL